MGISYWGILSFVFMLSSCGFEKGDAIEFSSIDSLSNFRTIESTSKLDALFNKQLNGKVELSGNGGAKTSEWKTYESNDQQLKFSIPGDWEIVSKEGYLLYCEIDERKEGFFVCLAHRKEEINVDLEEYKNFVIESTLSDSTEIFRLQELSLHTSKSRFSYYLQMGSQKEGIERKYYGFLTENEHFVFDISYCVIEEQQHDFADVYFMAALQSFQINSTPVLDNKSVIKDLDTTVY